MRNVYLNRAKRKRRKRRKEAIKENLLGIIGTLIWVSMLLLPFAAKIFEWQG